ncbi:MAG TPA: PspC domain-containing protein [Balneolales bacterium]|nr:PspC domain-containing protein [Balneolales bacterium]
MAEKTQQSPGRSRLEDYFTYSEDDLQVALDHFMEEQPASERKRENLWNMQTILGLGFIFLTLSFILQGVLSGIGLVPGLNLDSLMGALPVIGGILVVVIGFGFFTRERKQKKIRKREMKRRKRQIYSNIGTQGATASAQSTRRNSGFRTATRVEAEPYALRQHKKLTRSRTDKKMFGVCGGIANYFGVSATFVRLMFVIATLLGYGFPIILYLAMAIVVPKESVRLKDFDADL